MTTSQLLLNALAGGLLPLLVALVTHRLADSGLKALILVLLTVVSGTLTQHLNDARTDWRSIALAIVTQWVAAVAAHFGALKPLRVTGSRGAIAAMIPEGIGGPPPRGDVGAIRRGALIAAAAVVAVAGTVTGVVVSQTGGGSRCPGPGVHQAHVVIPATAGSCDVSGQTFLAGLEIGTFRAQATVRVTGSRMVIHNTTGKPGSPGSRGLAVLPGARVTLDHVTVSHTLSDSIGVLGGQLTLSDSRQWDAYGGLPDHVDGVQVTAGTITLDRVSLGLDPAGRPTRTGNVQCKGDAGLATCNLTDVTVAGYQQRIAVNYEAGAHGAAGSYQRLTIVTAGSSGAKLVIRGGARVTGSGLVVR